MYHYVLEGNIRIVCLELTEETRAGDSEKCKGLKITLSWRANGLKQTERPELLCDLAFNIRDGVSCRCLSMTQT